MITKILKNTTTSIIFIYGIRITPNGSYEIEQGEIYGVLNDTFLEAYVMNGDIVINDGAQDLSPTDGMAWLNTFYIDTTGGGGSGRSDWSWQIHKTSTSSSLTMNIGTWFDAYGQRVNTGSWSGYPSNSMPLIVPFDMRLKRAQLIFKKANYDWRATAGALEITLGFYTMVYNGASEYCLLYKSFGTTFTGSTSGDDTFVFDLIDFEVGSGVNLFTKNMILGVQLRKYRGVEGVINSIVCPIIHLHFEAVE
jgi:hypothetical protein